MLDTDSRLKDLATAFPGTTRVLRKHGFHYCCEGKRTVRDAADEQGLDVRDVVHEIARSRDEDRHPTRWDREPLKAVVKHLVDDFHVPLREELPRLVEQAACVKRAHARHGRFPPELVELLVELQLAVEDHLGKEAQILFPLILMGRGPRAFVPIHSAIQEHHDLGRYLAELRDATDGYRVPKGACASWRRLYEDLDRLEGRLMDHVHLENNVLFLRALAE